MMDNTADLIDQLCTFSGMILEDVNDVAIVRDGAVSAAARIERILAAANDVVTLARAAAIVAARAT